MNFSNKKIWTLTDGSQGMISQVLGLAQNFSKDILKIKTEIIFPWSIIQPGIFPIYRWIFKNNIDLNNKPDMIISCGRKSVYLSIYLKKLFLNKIVSIHIQDPKINLTNFDYVVAPIHDNLSGSNVIQSIGALHKFTKQNIEIDFSNFNKIPKKNLISVILGGKNNHYNFNEKNALDLINKIIILKNKYSNFNFLIIFSRRTDKNLINIFNKKLHNLAYVWNNKSSDPYIFSLKYSDFFIISSDSTSMISECAFTGKPIFIFNLPFKRNSKRLKKFHNEFQKRSITKILTNEVELKSWKYKTLDESKRISGILKERIIESKNES